MMSSYRIERINSKFFIEYLFQDIILVLKVAKTLATQIPATETVR
jgi:hypothetical protein